MRIVSKGGRERSGRENAYEMERGFASQRITPSARLRLTRMSGKEEKEHI